MKTLLPIAVLLAVPAQAQDARVFHSSTTWPVHVSAGTCTLTQATPDAGSALSVSYDGSEVTLTSTNEVESTLPPAGTVPFSIVFLENRDGNTDYDDGWGSRDFTYDSRDKVYRFSTRFAGERNARQILSDLASSRTIGLLQNGELVVSYELAAIRPSVARLRDCAAQTVAAN